MASAATAESRLSSRLDVIRPKSEPMLWQRDWLALDGQIFNRGAMGDGVELTGLGNGQANGEASR